MSYIYFIQDGNAVKIGHSADPEHRLKTLQTGNPRTLKILTRMEAPKRVEKELHRMMQGHRTQGEWFDLEKTLQTLLAKVFTLPDPSLKKEGIYLGQKTTGGVYHIIIDRVSVCDHEKDKTFFLKVAESAKEVSSILLKQKKLCPHCRSRLISENLFEGREPPFFKSYENCLVTGGGEETHCKKTWYSDNPVENMTDEEVESLLDDSDPAPWCFIHTWDHPLFQENPPCSTCSDFAWRRSLLHYLEQFYTVEEYRW